MGIRLFCWQCDVDESGAWQFDDVAIISERVHYHLAGICPWAGWLVYRLKEQQNFYRSRTFDSRLAFPRRQGNGSLQ